HVRPHLRARHAAWSRAPCRGGRHRPEPAPLLRPALRRQAAEETGRHPPLGVLLSMGVLVLASVASAQQAGEPTFEAVWIPLTETPSPGSPRAVKLEGMLYRPP